jgi:hypothetical protein
MDQNTEESGHDAPSPTSVHNEIQNKGTISEEQQWRQDASTLSEAEYMEKHYAKSIMV